MKMVDDLLKFARKRARELKDLATTEVTIAEVTANVAGQQVKFKVNVERIAAWELYVELNTRIATQELGSEEGLLREALSSLHALFGVTRKILREAGPGVAFGDESLGKYAMAILNLVLRPYLSRWHPLLSDWESARSEGVSAADHETAWDRTDEARTELARVQEMLRGYSDALALLAGLTEPDEGAK